ncbi:MAG TPA: DEAD/DEAH box helicase [Candidatus Cloacimonadota bacterium]|nr:DEAD/DEAH box helicase [Candidatus Cloacimonadota bacterium]HPS39328.1 DEAD/DEAH box helicase [Candidatus Cloacimonadota bacterium]
MTKFTDFTLPEPLLRAANDLNYEVPTSIQEKSIPWLLENDSDLIALAQTGTGKTASFGFPVLSQTDIEKLVVQTIILCPTRELCLQIAKDLQSYAKYMPRIRITAVYGGASVQKQKDALKAGVHIVVGTPGRVNDMIRQKVLRLGEVRRLILDEADEMLNMGFKEELFEIMGFTPVWKQTLLFSATMPKEVANLAKSFMRDPHRITVGDEHKGAANIQHFYYKVQARDKYLALKRIADMSPNIYGIVFCRTRIETQEIANKLQKDGYNADALHGDLSQGQRELTMNRFRSKYVKLLIATDVAARGLDVDDLTHIINFSPPSDPDVYIHRSGRTGRAGKSGISITIVHVKELPDLKAAEKRLGRDIVLAKVPEGREICEKQLFHFIDTVERVEVDEEKIETFLPTVYKKLSWLSREELIQRFVSVEFNRFLNYYKDTQDLTNLSETAVREVKKEYSFKTFRLTIGYNQQVTKRELMRYINQLKVTRGIEIGQIDLYPDYTLVELDGDFEAQLLKAFNRNKYRGVPLTATVVEAQRKRKRR